MDCEGARRSRDQAAQALAEAQRREVEAASQGGPAKKAARKARKSAEAALRKAEKAVRQCQRQEKRVAKVEARQEGRTERTVARQEGRTERTVTRQEGRTERTVTRQNPANVAARQGAIASVFGDLADAAEVIVPAVVGGGAQASGGPVPPMGQEPTVSASGGVAATGPMPLIMGGLLAAALVGVAVLRR